MALLPIKGVSIYGIERVLNKYLYSKYNQTRLWRTPTYYNIEVFINSKWHKFESTKSYDDAALQALKFYKKLQDTV